MSVDTIGRITYGIMDRTDDRVMGWDEQVGDMLGEEPEWQARGLCSQVDPDPDAFFPDKGGSSLEAKRICGLCDVKPECLQYALGNNEGFGIWGGLSERERRKLKQRGA